MIIAVVQCCSMNAPRTRYSLQALEELIVKLRTFARPERPGLRGPLLWVQSESFENWKAIAWISC